MAITNKNTETKNDKKDKISIVQIIQDIDARLTHLEDMQMDNRELIDNILDRHNDLKEFEDELEKHKDKITPGQVGES